jgi:3-oxoadipate enol-lactonase
VKRAAGIVYDERCDKACATRTPVVCLHGIGGDTGSFGPQLDGLSDTRRVIAWNMPGYGGSDPVADPTFPKLAARLVDFLDALGIDKAHLCGQSIGGMVAMEVACLFPDRVASLVLIGTTSAFGGRDDAFKDAFIAARLGQLDAGRTLPELAESFVHEITGPNASPQALEAARASMAAVPEATYRAIIRCLTTFNRREDIAQFTMPVCLIAGEHDTNAPARTMARMAEKIPGSEYHEIKGAGHLINLEAGEATNAILRDFYGRTA